MLVSAKLQTQIKYADRDGIHKVRARVKAELEYGMRLQLINSWIDPITEDETLVWNVERPLTEKERTWLNKVKC